jgi:hypothetical protein
MKDQDFVIGLHTNKSSWWLLMVWQRTKPLLEAKTQAEFDRNVRTLLGIPEDCCSLDKECNSTLFSYLCLICSGWMKKHVSSLRNKLWACFVLKVISSKNLEYDSQVDLNLQMLFAGSHENISQVMSWGTSMLLKRIKNKVKNTKEQWVKIVVKWGRLYFFDRS